nr:DMT family transporter [Cohnella luojiensis]
MPVIGVLLLNESVTLQGWIGILCIVAGIFLVGDRNSKGITILFNKSIFIALLVGIMITAYTVTDKVTLEYFPPYTLNWATNVGNLLTLTFIALKSQDLRHEWKINWKTILLGGILSSGGYILFLKALEIMPVSQMAPMREIGTVFGTLMGIFILQEQQGRSRIVASILITAGIVLLAQ